MRIEGNTIDIGHTEKGGYYVNKINVEEGPMEAALKAKEEGLIKHICFSFHDAPENLFKLIDTGNFETVLCQYNLLDRSNEEAIVHAKEQYGQIGSVDWLKGKKAEDCIECGICESKCPQKIEIRKQLRETASVLG